MKTLTFVAAPLLALLLAPLVGCKGPERRETDFLSDYSKLEERSDGRLIYVNPRIEPGTYQRFIVDPVNMNLDEKREGKFSEKELEELVEYFYDTVVEHISKNRQVVTRPAPGVARMRIALTDVQTSKALLNILPQMRLLTAGRGGAAFEGELVDSTTGAQVAAVVHKTREGTFSGGGMSKMSDAKRAIDEWAEEFAEQIEGWQATQAKE